MKIKIDYSRDELLTQQGKELIQKHYMKEGDTSPQDAFARACMYFGSDDEHAQRLYDAVSRLHFMFSSPILSNCSPTDRGLPISCFLSYVPDTLEGLIGHEIETKWLSVYGGGVGGHWNDIRCVSSKSPGPIPFLHSVDGALTAYKQGETRKGAYAAYMDISHPDIREFISVRVPGGDINRKSTNIHNAINIPDIFMEAVESNGEWALIDPKTGSTKEVVKARELWELALTVRHRTGEPYFNFIDTANRFLHPAQQKLNLSIKGSNLCNEIHLVTDEERTAVCCLASLNLETLNDWSETLVQDLVEMLDNVLEVFINKAPDNISRARYAAERSRDIGIGAMGWHGLLMKRMIPFESDDAVRLTRNIFSYIKAEAQRATIRLATIRGSCPDAVDAGYKCRNLHLLAIAPNANSSIMANCTASIEPVNSNAYAHRTRIGTHLVKNQYLQELLENKVPWKTLNMMGMTSTEWINKQWELIIQNEGSVQKLHCLSDDEKAVFKTFKEINMIAVINQASARQEFLCQGQSVNLYFKANADKGLVNYIHYMAWKMGLKGLYYLRTGSVVQADKVSSAIVREILGDAEECTACHA
jgi:ribonucleoside-diphosphate reductase alpha chain